MRTRLRWRSCSKEQLEEVTRRLEDWACPAGGAVRHMFPLSAIESSGVAHVRVAGEGDQLGVAVVFPGRLLVPCGDPDTVASAGLPTRRWRLLVGDAAAAVAVLRHERPDPDLRVHVQRFLTVDPDAVPLEDELPDPGLRRAVPQDVRRLAELAVRLHVDDGFGPDPGRAGLRGYARRFDDTVDRGLVYCVGPVGAPIAKLERSVSSPRYGVQLAGIVVDPAHRRRGIGRGAVAAAVRGALAEMGAGRPVSLHVRADNQPALRAYEVAGFRDREEWRLAVRP